jgi:hypothetical protein
MRAALLGLCLLVPIAGCGDSTRASVSGIVTMGGQPVANAAISFQPTGTELNPGPGSFGKTNDKGEYTLEMVGGGRGAVVGWHKVTIHPGGDAAKTVTKYVIKGEPKFEVKPGSNTANFEVTTK